MSEDALSDSNLADSLDADDAEAFQRSLPRESLTPEQRAASEAEYFETPDAVEVPLEQPARYRFLKYRGLQSFRLSPWDPKENLPAEYAALTEFADFEASQKAALAEQETRMAEEETPAGERVLKAGTYVEVGLRVSRGWMERRVGGLPVLLSWLLPFEEKRTVMHASVQRCSAWTPQPLKSRDLLVAHVGFRRVPVRPLFAEAGLRCEKCKYVKWVPPAGFFQMVFYAPMTYRPAPVTLVLPRQAPGEVGVARGLRRRTWRSWRSAPSRRPPPTLWCSRRSCSPAAPSRCAASSPPCDTCSTSRATCWCGWCGPLTGSGSSRSSCTRSWDWWDTSASRWEPTAT